MQTIFWATVHTICCLLNWSRYVQLVRSVRHNNLGSIRRVYTMCIPCIPAINTMSCPWLAFFYFPTPINHSIMANCPCVSKCKYQPTEKAAVSAASWMLPHLQKVAKLQPPKTSSSSKGKCWQVSTDLDKEENEESEDESERTSMDSPMPKHCCKAKCKSLTCNHFVTNSIQSSWSTSMLDEVDIPDLDDEVVEVRSWGLRASSIANETVATSGENLVRFVSLMLAWSKKLMLIFEGIGKWWGKQWSISIASEEGVCTGFTHHFLRHLQGEILSYEWWSWGSERMMVQCLQVSACIQCSD